MRDSRESPIARCVICGAVVQIHPSETREGKRCAGCVGEALGVEIGRAIVRIVSPRECGERA